MSGEFDVAGRDQLHELGLKLKLADRKTRLRFSKAMRDATKPIKDELKASALETLPHGGGLARRVASSKITNRTSTTATGASVRIRGASPLSIKAMNDGRLRHPLFGNTKFWFDQTVRPDWWDKPFRNPALTQAVQTNLKHVMDETAREFT